LDVVAGKLDLTGGTITGSLNLDGIARHRWASLAHVATLRGPGGAYFITQEPMAYSSFWSARTVTAVSSRP